MTLPIRARLTAWYAILLAAIVVGLGAFLVVQLRADLRATIDRDVEGSSAELAREFAAEGAEDFRDVAETALPRSGAAAQLLDGRGGVVVAYGDPVGHAAMVGADARAAATAGSSRLLDVKLGANHERFRALVSPVRYGDRRNILVVAESLEEVEDAVERVLVLMLLAGPAALAVTALGGWLIARKALRPVDRMTSQAEEIGIDRLHERITVPRADDEVGHLAVTLNAMLDRLERGVEDRHRLVADASHELRTPLAVMRSELDVRLRSPGLAADAREAFESVREEVDGMTRTVDNLLTLAQVDEGRLELLRSSVTLRDEADAAAQRLAALAAAKGVRLEVDGEPCEVRADPQRLGLALRNLIENAIKYTPAGGAVRVTCRQDDREAGVTVADDGPGIPAAVRDQVFDRFFRADPARVRTGGGSGLGLAICREIARAHGGRVWVDGVEGGGSAFHLVLPREPARGLRVDAGPPLRAH